MEDVKKDTAEVAEEESGAVLAIVLAFFVTLLSVVVSMFNK